MILRPFLGTISMPDTSYIVKLNKAMTRADARDMYLVAEEGDDCGCECCREWYVFKAAYTPWHRYPYETPEGPFFSNRYAVPELLRQYPDMFSDPSAFTGYRFPRYIAICAHSFKPYRPTSLNEYNDHWEVANSPDVRYFENYVYGEGGASDAIGYCGTKNTRRAQQSEEWMGPVFRHVIWSFIVDFSKESTSAPFFMDWPRWAYHGTLTDMMTTTDVLDYTSIGDIPDVMFVERLKSTGEHNCQNAGCSNWYAYDRKIPDTGYSSAYVEHEMHFGCRPLLCTGDWEYHSGWGGSYYLNDLYEGGNAPCDMGCMANINIYQTNYAEFPCHLGQAWRPVNLKASEDDFRYEVVDDGTWGGQREILLPQSRPDFHPTDWRSRWIGSSIQEATEFVNNGFHNLRGKLNDNNKLATDSYKRQIIGPLASAEPLSDFYLHNSVGENFPFLVPNWDDESWLTSILRDDYGYPGNTVLPFRYWCRSPVSCLRTSNPVTRGEYTWDPLPYIPWTEEGRMFVDVVPMTGQGLQPYSVYLKYLADPEVRKHFISEHSEKVVSDVDGNQYLVSEPYEIQESGRKDERGTFLPRYDRLLGETPRLRQEPVLPLVLDQLSQLSVEFTVSCAPGLNDEVCFNNFNVLLFPSENINKVEKRIVFSNVEYLIKAFRSNDLIEISICVPYGVAFKEYTRVVKVTCVDSGHCTFDVVDTQTHGQYRVEIQDVVFQQ